MRTIKIIKKDVLKDYQLDGYQFERMNVVNGNGNDDIILNARLRGVTKKFHIMKNWVEDVNFHLIDIRADWWIFNRYAIKDVRWIIKGSKEDPDDGNKTYRLHFRITSQYGKILEFIFQGTVPWRIDLIEHLEFLSEVIEKP